MEVFLGLVLLVFLVVGSIFIIAGITVGIVGIVNSRRQNATNAPSVRAEDLGIDRVDEGQDVTLLARIAKDARAILIPNETIAYIAHQGNGRKDAIVATSSRIILYQIRRHSPTFDSVSWEDVQNTTINEGPRLRSSA